MSRFEKECCSTVGALVRPRPRYLCEMEGYGENRVGGEEEKLVQAKEAALACLMGEA